MTNTSDVIAPLSGATLALMWADMLCAHGDDLNGSAITRETLLAEIVRLTEALSEQERNRP